MPKNMPKNLPKSSKQPSNREYLNSLQAAKQLQRRADYERYARNLLNFLPLSKGRLLDVGCGLGWVVKEANARGYKARGIDPATPYVRLGQKTFGLDLKVSNLENFQSKEKYNAIVLNHTLEHIKDLDKFLKRIHSLLSKKGYLLVACPNIASLMYYIFKSRWYGLVPTQHHQQFTPKTLAGAISQNGFIIRKVIVNSLDYQVPGLKGLAFGILTTLANVTRLGDQVIVLAQKS